MRTMITLCLCFLSFTSVLPASIKIKVLIVNDANKDFYRFEGTAPLLQQSLNETADIEADLVNDAEVLATDKVFAYDVLLLHFKNYKPLKAQEQAQKNLIKFVNDGRGLYIYHFACGAFEDWKEFEKLIGRIWEPDEKKNMSDGKHIIFHDVYGKFKVHYTNTEHPITKGLTDFETQDELYHCFKPSEVPITVLAESVSNINNKAYPMAFVLQYGKGRVYHTTLGHDAASVTSEGFVKLHTNAVRWLGRQ